MTMVVCGNETLIYNILNFPLTERVDDTPIPHVGTCHPKQFFSTFNHLSAPSVFSVTCYDVQKRILNFGSVVICDCSKLRPSVRTKEFCKPWIPSMYWCNNTIYVLLILILYVRNNIAEIHTLNTDSKWGTLQNLLVEM